MFTLGIIKSFKTVMCSVTPQDGEQVFHFIRHIWSQTFLFQSTIRSFYSAETLCAKCQQSSIKGVRCFMTSRSTIFHGILQRLKYLYPDALHFWKPTIIFLKNPSGGSVVCRLKLRCLAGVPGRWTLQKDNYTVWILKDKWAWEGGTGSEQNQEILYILLDVSSEGGEPRIWSLIHSTNIYWGPITYQVVLLWVPWIQQ